MRYFLELSYRGTAFHGWQIQTNAHTVQAEIQKALSTIFQRETEIVGSGRTDTGVHASHQVAHFDFEAISDLSNLQYRLNNFLPETISINRIRPVKVEAHARFDAKLRTYHYFMHASKNPFKDGLSYLYTRSLNLDSINEATEVIKSWTDFQAFSKVHTDVNTFNCEIFDAKWEQTNDGYQFCVSANRFLRGMIRAMVGTLLDVGLNKMSINQLEEVLKSGNRSKAGRAVPPEGLYLSDVKYPENIYLD